MMKRILAGCVLVHVQARRQVVVDHQTDALQQIQQLKDNENPVIEIFLYRAQEYEGVDGQYALENVDMADLSGVLQYIHREIITEHQIGSVDKVTGKLREARKYDINHLLQYRFLVKNPIEQSKVQMDFHGYETYDFGQASNKATWNGLKFADHVGLQRQSNKFVPFRDPYYWFSLSGFCPNLPYTRAAITAVCAEDLGTSKGTCESKMEALPLGCSSGDANMKNQCMCYKGGNPTVVWGGLCGATQERRPPAKLDVPTGQRGCTYSYEAKPKEVNLDELVGVTEEDCGGRKCKDYSDFRVNCANQEYRKYFSPLGSKKNADFCVEYDLHPDCAQMGCDSRACLNIRASDREIGLPFWKGRCNAEANTARAEAAARQFGMEKADQKHIVTQPSSEGYADVSCQRPPPNLECKANTRTGEGMCTRAWTNVCTSCRIGGFKSAALNAKTPYCPWNVLKGYPAIKAFSCKSRKASDLCCLYLNTCEAPADGLNDDSLATVLHTQNTEEIQAYFIRIAKELLGISDVQIKEKAEDMGYHAYWAWGQGPVQKLTENDKVTLKSAADTLNKAFPGSQVYTTTTTTTTTTTRTRRTFKPLVVIRKTTTTTTIGAMEDFDCECAMEAVVNGVNTNRPGCAEHAGRKFGNFCYMEGGGSCPGGPKFSKKLGLWYRKCDPDLEIGAP